MVPGKKVGRRESFLTVKASEKGKYYAQIVIQNRDEKYAGELPVANSLLLDFP